jgi:hypothetical protein
MRTYLNIIIYIRDGFERKDNELKRRKGREYYARRIKKTGL